LISAFTRSQIAAIFATSIATIIPAKQFSGMIDRCRRWRAGALRRRDFSATHFVTICRGTFPRHWVRRPRSVTVAARHRHSGDRRLERLAVEETGALAVHTLFNIFHLGVKELRSLGRDT